LLSPCVCVRARARARPGYYEGAEDYYAHTAADADVHTGFDLHREPTPRCGANCSTRAWGDVGSYSTNLFGAEAVRVIEAHDAAEPLFLFQAWQGVHFPRQAPMRYVGAYNSSIADPARRVFAGMVSAVDEGIGNISAALAAKGMLDDSVIIVSTDNGGPTTECAAIGASNYPLRGGKCSVWEGGTRGTALVSSRRHNPEGGGFEWAGLMHAADWLPTLVRGAAGLSIPAGATQPLDGLDLWEALTTNRTSTTSAAAAAGGGAGRPGDEVTLRRHLYYGMADSCIGAHGPAIRSPDGWKLIRGGGGGGAGAHPANPVQPPSGAAASAAAASTAGSTVLSQPPGGAAPLLFNVLRDASERQNVSIALQAAVVADLNATLSALWSTGVPQATGDPRCPKYAPHNSSQGQWVGPWCDDY